MTGVDPIRDLRFEGMDIPQLTDWIGKIKQGRGSESMNRAVQALDQCVQVVVDLDDTLRTELGNLGIAWEGNAGDLAQAAAQQRSVVMQQAQDPLRGSARSVEAQGRGFDSAKHSLPNSDELRHKQSENFFEWAGGAFGYESDYDAEAKQIDGRKKAAQAALGSYRDTTVTQAQQYQPLPQMPAPTVAASAGPPGAVPTVGAPGFGGDAVASGGGFLGAEQSTTGFLGGERSTSGGGRAGSDEPSAGGRSGTEDHRADSAEPGGNADPAPEGGDSGIGLGGVLGIGAGGAAVAGIGEVAAGRLLGGQGGA
ncbi:hypothetical protein, partial [Saccharopolyspora rosea]|uniref:hypothetical protein n=1 Tax=Saccharopolyspora rosea TaxID=524884 RepID=UPI0031EE2293